MEIVGFYGPKSWVTARGAHAAQTRACQDEEPKTEKTEKWHGGTVPRGTVVPWGTGAPCHRQKFCRLILAARVWLGGIFSAAATVFPRGKKPTFQTLYKGVKPRF